jgi:hypothetical protein
MPDDVYHLVPARQFGRLDAGSRRPPQRDAASIDWLRIAAWIGGLAFSVAVWAGIALGLVALAA